MPRSLAGHILHIDLEFFHANEYVSEITKKNAWYSWRIDWVKEVISIFRLSMAEIAKYLDDEISRVGLDLDKRNEKQIMDRFVAFCGTDDIWGGL